MYDARIPNFTVLITEKLITSQSNLSIWEVLQLPMASNVKMFQTKFGIQAERALGKLYFSFLPTKATLFEKKEKEKAFLTSVIYCLKKVKICFVSDQSFSNGFHFGIFKICQFSNRRAM